MKKDKNSSLGKKALIAAICLLLVAIINPFTFGYFSVCSICGKWRGSSEKSIPILGITYWPSHKEKHTELSRIVESYQLVGHHEHQWVFGHGRSYSISASGPYSSPERYTGKDSAATVEAIIEAGYRAEAKIALKSILDYTTPGVWGAPDGGFESDAHFKYWWELHCDYNEVKAPK